LFEEGWEDTNGVYVDTGRFEGYVAQILDALKGVHWFSECITQLSSGACFRAFFRLARRRGLHPKRLCNSPNVNQTVLYYVYSILCFICSGRDVILGWTLGLKLARHIAPHSSGWVQISLICLLRATGTIPTVHVAHPCCSTNQWVYDHLALSI